MKNKSLVVVLLLVVLAALSLVGVVAAQDDTPAAPDGSYGGCGYEDCLHNDGQGYGNGYGHGRGMVGGLDNGWMHEFMVAAFADVLDLDQAEIEAQIEAGFHMWDIAADSDLSDEEFQRLMTDAREQALERAVEEGLIDAEWAAWMLERMGGMHSGGYGYGKGGCSGGGRGHWDAAPVNPDGSSG